MRERVRLVQGTLSIGTTPGGGTTIDAFVPINGRKGKFNAAPNRLAVSFANGGLKDKESDPGPSRNL
jgi:hypothetical protein